jgi:hypothetical protein
MGVDGDSGHRVCLACGVITNLRRIKDPRPIHHMSAGGLRRCLRGLRFFGHILRYAVWVLW